MRRKLSAILSAVLLCALCVAPAHALEYSIDGADDYLFGRPTSDDTIYEWENPNVDRSKNTALIPPGFGTPTSYLPGSGEYLTPPRVPGALNGGLVNQVGSVGSPDGGTSLDASGNYPTADTSVSVDSNGFPTVGGGSTGGPGASFTDVSNGMYLANGSLGTLKIPSIGLTVGVYEGTGSAPLLKGAGHFENTSIWLGNVPIAGHNRGVRSDFGKIHTLKAGDIITLTTVLGTRTYAVSSVSKVDVSDTSGLASTTENCITLYTCVEDQPAYTILRLTGTMAVYSEKVMDHFRNPRNVGVSCGTEACSSWMTCPCSSMANSPACCSPSRGWSWRWASWPCGASRPMPNSAGLGCPIMCPTG